MLYYYIWTETYKGICNVCKNMAGAGFASCICSEGFWKQFGSFYDIASFYEILASLIHPIFLKKQSYSLIILGLPYFLCVM